MNFSFSQDAAKYTRDSIALSNIKETQIALDTIDRFTKGITFPFKFITIADVRFDTTNIGIYSVANYILIPAIKNYKINFKNGAGKSLSAYINNFFERSFGNGDTELVCYLKKLSIVKRDTLVENTSLHRVYGQLSFQAEVFLRTGSDFHGAFKIDTVLTESIGVKKREVIDELKNSLLMPALSILQNKIIDIEWNRVMKKKSFSESEVHENYFIHRFSLPVLTQQNKKGIYKTFSEFKNNVPSIVDFEVRKGKFGTILLIDKNGNNIVTTKLFGFNDGERWWILNGNFCYPLIKTGNSFEFFINIIYNLKLLLEIDMETGQ